MNCLWTSELSGEVVGVIGLAHTSPHSVKIDEFRIRPEWQHTSIPKRLLEQVRQYCSDSGRMKLQVETGTVPGWLVTQIGRSGFRMAREAAVNGKTMHEFYLDLYHESQSDSGTRQPVLRVLLADDHSVLRKGICEMLHERPGIEVVGEAQDGQEAVQMALAIQPDVVLMDVTMPRMDGIEATRRITSQLPRVRIIGLSMHEGNEVASAMRAAGARGYLSKSDPCDTILAAVVGA